MTFSLIVAFLIMLWFICGYAGLLIERVRYPVKGYPVKVSLFDAISFMLFGPISLVFMACEPPHGGTDGS